MGFGFLKKVRFRETQKSFASCVTGMSCRVEGEGLRVEEGVDALGFGFRVSRKEEKHSADEYLDVKPRRGATAAVARHRDHGRVREQPPASAGYQGSVNGIYWAECGLT